MSLLTGTVFSQQSYQQPDDGIQLFPFPKWFEAIATYQTTTKCSEPMTHYLDRFAPQQTPVVCKKPEEGAMLQHMNTSHLSSLFTHN
jgi:hypothetical protein